MGKKGKGNNCSSLKGLDMFGYQVNLKYMGEESKRKSIIGAIFTLVALTIVL